MLKRLLVLFLFLMLAKGAWAQTIIEDDFNDSLIGSEWTITQTNAGDSWTYGESGTQLGVTGVTVGTGTATDAWTSISFSQDINPLGDFDIDVDLYSYSAAANSDMQSLFLRLYTENGTNLLVTAGVHDAWRRDRARNYAQIGESWTFGSIEADVIDAHLDIIRTGTEISILWDGADLLSGASAEAIDKIELEFRHYNYSSGSSFGSEAVDYIKVTDGAPAVPVPSAFFILGFGLLALVGLQRRKA